MHPLSTPTAVEVVRTMLSILSTFYVVVVLMGLLAEWNAPIKGRAKDVRNVLSFMAAFGTLCLLLVLFGLDS